MINEHNNYGASPLNMEYQRARTLQNIKELTKSASATYSESNTVNDPDYPQWVKDVAKDVLEGKMSWNQVHAWLHQRFPSQPSKEQE